MDRDLPHGLKIATVWLLAGAAIFVGLRWWEHRAQQTRFRLVGEAVEIRRGADGHYHWPGTVGGSAVDFLVDTGATRTAIPATLARELGLASLGQVQSNTAGGVVTGEIVLADVALRGGIRAERLRVVALQGLGEHPLLGMDVLGGLHWQQRDAVLRIEPAASR